MGKWNRISDEDLKIAVASSINVMAVLEKLGLKKAGGTHSHYSKRIKFLGIDTSHFLGHRSNLGKTFKVDRDPASVLVLRTVGSRQRALLLVKALIDVGVPHECDKCGQGTEWLGNKLTLDVDHINENWLDDRQENLRFLCPNCHSQFSRNLLQ